MLVPILDEIICGAADRGTRHTIIGMAHRGRLNVLAHVLQKPYAQILAEFKDPVGSATFRLDQGWMGDVKYHAGARTASPRGQMHVTLAPNPSHLEAVDPVVVGMARAAGTVADAPGAPHFDGASTLPVLIHGDSAFAGQGIVAETLNLSRLAGYDTDGTLHIITNNQLGFTATPAESYSTSYASGLARGFKIPIVHVNADDPVACLEAARPGLGVPRALPPRFRHRPDRLPPARPQRRRRAGVHAAGHVQESQCAANGSRAVRGTAGEAGQDHRRSRRRARQEALRRAGKDVRDAEARTGLRRRYPRGAAAGAGGADARPACRSPRCATSTRRCCRRRRGSPFTRSSNAAATAAGRSSPARRDERTIDWAAAEELAFATILADGTPIRLTGEDVQRGTFSHRHAVYHDANTGKVFVPLQEFTPAKASFEIHNSPLSENGAIGFEFGYNVQEPSRLVIWEAQYGDFINGAQVMLDQFVTSSRAKWGQQPSLVFLLPHGYEGQGPEHSSARPERFLQAAADINLRLVNCTTAAQYFHLLRRQAALLTRDPLPLVVLTPKSLLRHPAVASTPSELEHGPLPVGHRRCRGAAARQRASSAWCSAAARSTST